MGWYAGRCLIRVDAMYEERITLWNASSFDVAIQAAETEASEYAGAVDGDLLEQDATEITP